MQARLIDLSQLLQAASRLQPDFPEATKDRIGRFYLASRKVRSSSHRSGGANEIHKKTCKTYCARIVGWPIVVRARLVVQADPVHCHPTSLT